ncbi:hypothetical protein [Hydrogenophaga sp.]|uniref:hypothetical protein n=1 Tax=Hydrogenophaga sp. TaxID=1904254 RepID=UPI002732276E|nr:hypothetical protein [Hydrogenophaga sp.]MDP2075154.1 hypothetical protein [Hydrogenophaga sp.]MDP3108409.1 hypothetical protein [Hydrogenophaga sp.]
MKIFFLASQPEDGAQLALDQLISSFQTKLLARRPPNVEIVFFSDLSIEDIRSRVREEKPDILHISGHSDFGSLRFRNEARNVVDVGPGLLAALIPADCPIKCIVLGSCNSLKLISKDGGLKAIPCVGFDGRVDLQVASIVLLTFYEELLSGATLEAAFSNSVARLALEQSDVSLHIECADKSQLNSALYRPPVIVVRPVATNEKKRSTFDLPAHVEVGVDGAPSDIVQIVFFTDEREWAEDTSYPAESELTLECWRASLMSKIVYGPTPIGGCIWSTSSEFQACDERLYAAAIRSNGSSFVLKSSVSEGIDAALSRGLIRAEEEAIVVSLARELRAAARNRSIFRD